MKRKTRKTRFLTMTAIAVLVGNTAVCAGAEAARATETETKTGDWKESACEPGEHIWSDWMVLTEANCVTEGLEKRICEECGTEETRTAAINEKHDLKEIGRETASEDTPEMILYECQRDGCDHQEKKEAGLREAAWTLNPDGETSDPDIGSDEGLNADESPEPDEIFEPGEDPEPDDPPESEEELPEIDPDTIVTVGTELPEYDWEDEEYLAYASCTSTEIVTEYDPETAVGVIQVATDPGKPEETEPVEGKTVPGGTTKISRDADGNITDLKVSTSVSEIRNGFSLSIETGTLHSITLIHEDVPDVDWITLIAEKPAGELGIRLQYTEDKMVLSLTENNRPLQIVKAENEEDEVILTMSSGSKCRISKKVRWFTTEEVDFSDRVDHVIFSSNEEGILEAKFASAEKDEKIEEMLYWIVPYEDVASEPVVITIYKDAGDKACRNDIWF